ncbi:MAG: translesion DNA synthesis-associated protein ImuA [Caldimonas sp.]
MEAVPAPVAASSRLALPGGERRFSPRQPVRGVVARDDVRRSPETLHPALWLGHQLGRIGNDAVASGFPALDAELPGGGWPRRALSELLLPHAGVGEIRLLAPPLVEVQRAGRLVMVFDPPAALSAAALAGFGFDVEELLVVNTRARVVPGSDSLWALEQALKSGHVGAVVAWLPPRLRAERLRRLQLAAHAHDGPAFVMREAAVAGRPTASPLRLGLQAGGADRLCVRVLKRRGPPLEAPLSLDLPTVLSAAARRRAGSERGAALPAATFVDFA